MSKSVNTERKLLYLSELSTIRCVLQFHAKSGLALVMTQLMLTISLYVIFWNIDSRGIVVGTATV